MLTLTHTASPTAGSAYVRAESSCAPTSNDAASVETAITTVRANSRSVSPQRWNTNTAVDTPLPTSVRRHHITIKGIQCSNHDHAV